MRALDLCGVIFHDGLSPEFIGRYRTPRIRFRRVAPGRWSTNDYRFFVYRRFLAGRRFRAAFLTDISDVSVVRDPFEGLRRARWPLVIGDEVYPRPYGRLVRTHPWLRERIRETEPGCPDIARYFRDHRFRLATLNAGVIGGRSDAVVAFLDAFVNTRRLVGRRDHNLNMAVVNYVFHRFHAGRFHHGAPVTSRFKAFERQRTDVWFIHK
jgi:hypothetical protein